MPSLKLAVLTFIPSLCFASPSAKWGQSTKDIFLTVSGLPCEDSQHLIAVDRIIWHCDDINTTLLLREDIVVHQSACKVPGKFRASCRLTKVYQHIWDRVSDSFPASIDWSQWPEEANDNSLDPYDGFKDAPIFVSPEELTSLSGTVFAVMYMHWCRICDHKARAVVDAKRAMVNQAIFVRLDVLEHRELARRAGATCSWDCKLLALPSERFVDVPATADDKGLITLRRLASPASVTVSSMDEVVAPALILGSGDEAAFDDAAEALRIHDISFYKFAGGLLEAGVQALAEDDSKYDCAQASNLTACAIYATAPLLTQGYGAFDSPLRSVVAPQLHVIVPSLDDDAVEVGKAAASNLRGVATGKLRVNDSYAFYDFGIIDTTKSIFGLVESDDYKAKRYLYPLSSTGGGVELAEWVQGLLRSNEEARQQYRALRTSLPESSDHLVSATLDLSSAMVLVVYNTWESKQKLNAEAIMTELPELLQPMIECRALAVGMNEIEPSVQFGVADESKVYGVWILPDKTKVASLKKPATVAAKAVAKHSAPDMQAHILENIQALAQRKIQAKAAAAELEERASRTLPIQVADGVSKRVYIDGDGPYLEKGQSVAVHYVGHQMSTGKQFDSSRKRGREPITVNVGAGSVIPCWDKALATMRVGDRAKLECRSDQAYGDTGRVAGDLEFDVEVIRIEKNAAAPHIEL